MKTKELWRPNPSTIPQSHLFKFWKLAFAKAEAEGEEFDFASLYRWSIEEPSAFWRLVAKYSQIVWRKDFISVYQPPKNGGLLGAEWFSGGKLNFAENFLWKTGETVAITAFAEGGGVREVSWDMLRAEVARIADGLRSSGVKKGDRVAAVMANTPEAIIAMLATTSIGAVWSSCSPDFGVPGIIDRLGQIEPKVIFFTHSYHYNGKRFSCVDKIQQCKEGLKPDVEFIKVNHLDADEKDAWKAYGQVNAEIIFEDCDFSDPVYIMFSSGTTGVPKCIVHSIGGTLLQHKKELLLHCNLDESKKLCYFTTCGWMMWNWMVSGLSVGANVVLYEGSPGFPDLTALWRFVDDVEVTHFGTSPKFLMACEKAKIVPKDLLRKKRLQCLMSTGAPLLPEQYHWVYDSVAGDVHLASISGGTDIISCFMLGVPTLPVYEGEIQHAGLGMAVAVFDENAQAVVGKKGELVCEKPFVSMPVGFWNDPDKTRYRSAYFEQFSAQGKEVWCHGDYIEQRDNGGIVVYGRSDATLNPGGVRIGTAEIYRRVEELPFIKDSIAVGKRVSGDVDVILFVILADGGHLESKQVEQIKDHIKKHLTPRHVPQQVICVNKIPYTKSGKKVEIAATQAIHGEQVKNINALEDPTALSEFESYYQENK